MSTNVRQRLLWYKNATKGTTNVQPATQRIKESCRQWSSSARARTRFQSTSTTTSSFTQKPVLLCVDTKKTNKWTTEINLVLDLNRSPYQPLVTNLLEFVEEGDHAVDRLRATRSTGVENAYKLDILVRAIHLQHFSINALLAQMAKQLPRPAFLKITW